MRRAFGFRRTGFDREEKNMKNMMKKKQTWIALLTLLALLLTGCQSAPKKPDLPLNEAITKAIPDMEQLVSYNQQDLSDLLGIDEKDFTEAVFLADCDSLSGREVIAVRAKDAGSLKTIAAALGNYLSQRKLETRDYLPEAYQLQNEAKVETKNLTAALFIGPNAAEECKAFMTGE